MNKSRKFSQKEYKKTFAGDIRKNALAVALDVRKFEIDLYWKRATYFWAFIASTIAAYGAVHALPLENKTDLTVTISCLGIVFSFGWLCVNRGSKHWQENWENHVDMLEDCETGPIYKVVLKRPPPKGSSEIFQHAINGPSEYSVSKINQIISLYISVLWVAVLIYSLPPIRFTSPINTYYLFIVALTFVTCALFVTKLGATHTEAYIHNATLRSTEINNDN